MNNFPAIFGAVFCNIIAQCLMKYSSLSSLGQPLLETLFSWKILCAILAYGFSFICMFIVFKTNELSIISPITGGLSFILLSICSSLFFNEQITINKIFGIVFITLGIHFLNK